jgi:hypothetical protein
MTQSKDLVQEPIARKWYIIEQTLTSEKNSFSIRIANYWNKLPENNSFKNRLDKHWKDEELYYANYKADMYMLSGCELIDTENIGLTSQNMKFVGE